MPELYLKSNDKHLGHISHQEMEFLVKHLEEESLTDEDYTIGRLTLDYMKTQSISPNLARLLEQALGDADEVEIRYTTA
jgi:hypothetical protein